MARTPKQTPRIIEDKTQAETPVTPARKTRGKSAPENETREEAFRRLALRRTRKLLHAIDNLGNLSNRSQYAYTDEQVTKIFDTLATALEKSMQRFRSKKKASETFDL